MTKQTGIIIAVILALVGIAVLLRRREPHVGTNPRTGRTCVKVPKGFARWTGDFSGTDWGNYGAMRQRYLNQDPDDNESRTYVDSFFKNIDVEPKGSYVRHFAEDIKAYISSSAAVPHWDFTQPGTLRCPE